MILDISFAAVSEFSDRNRAAIIAYVFLAALFTWNLTSYLSSPLRQFPGPLLAGWTNLWRMFHVRQGKYQMVVQDLHKKYGPVVRIAPNVLDLDIPELIKVIYNTKADYLKTEFYHGSSAKANGKIIYNLFSECDPIIHAQQKRPISQHYSLSGVLLLEPHVNEMTQYLCQRLEETFIDEHRAIKTCNLGNWILFYTWDVVGKTTFSQPIGYLEKGYDFDKTLMTSKAAMDYFSVVSQMPILDHLLDKNPLYRIGPPSFGTITNISIQHLADRLHEREAGNLYPGNPDFLDRFVDAKGRFPDIVSEPQIISYLMINMIAGADTTSITINAALYYSLKDARIWERLRSEVPVYDPMSEVPVMSYKSAKEFPYLDCVVREALRYHPAVAMPLERYVPKDGLTLPDGRCVPAGCIVGINPYIVGRNRSVWGDDADVFRPERWERDKTRETEQEYQERLRLMNDADLTFGGGSRVCIGKNLGLLEVYKVLATLISRYNIALTYPDRDWKTHNSFFVRQTGIEVRLSRRR